MLYITENETANITKDDLINDLKNIGIKKSDMIYVHSSLKSIGWLENGPDTLIEAFLSVLGKDGTLAVPTHTNSFIGLGRPPFESDNTPTYLGKFPEAVRNYPLAKRSGHASHSSAAIGSKAGFLTENHDPLDALGYDSPVYRMVRSMGKILLIGVSHKTNTTVHLAESIAGLYCELPYSKACGEYVHAKLTDGSVKEYKQVEFPGCSNGFDIIEKSLIDRNLVTLGKVGNADSKLIDADGMVKMVVEMIKEKPDILLCGWDRCTCCPPRKNLLGL